MARCSSFVSALALALPPRLPAHSPVFGAAFLGACFVGIVVNPVSMGHITSLDSPQNGHVTPCGTPFVVLYGPETLNVFWHFVQVTIFSIFNSYFCSVRRGPERPSGWWWWWSRCPVQLSALLTEACELWFLGVRCVATLRADKPTSQARQHRPEKIFHEAVWTAYDLLSHSRRPSFSLPTVPGRLSGRWLCAVPG
jgi:hypothetical protein